MDQSPLSVQTAVEQFNDILSAAAPAILVEGEVADFKVNRGKYVFFDIKDEVARLSCFMMTHQLKFPLEDGMQLRLVAQPKLTDRGKFSLIIRALQPIGEGSLKRSFDLLKTQLEKEGLFAASRKRSLPALPQTIGIVSSAQAAGYHDFIKILNNRWGGVEVQLADVSVQGLVAADEIVRAINYFNNQSKLVEVLVVVRGGGSQDDLAVFNHEAVVRALAASRVPTLVGVGHETDTTLSDLVADNRASTPSNAAECLVPTKAEFRQRLQTQQHQLQTLFHHQIDDYQRQVDNFEQSWQQQISQYTEQLTVSLQHQQRLLKQYNPRAILARGYSLVRKNGQLIKSKTDVILGDEINLTLRDGTIGARVEHVD